MFNEGQIFRQSSTTLTIKQDLTILPTFNKTLAEVVINNILFLLFGYINLAEQFFPYQKQLQQADFFDNYIDIKTFLNEQIQKKKIDFPQSITWCKVMEKIIY